LDLDLIGDLKTRARQRDLTFAKSVEKILCEHNNLMIICEDVAKQKLFPKK